MCGIFNCTVYTQKIFPESQDIIHCMPHQSTSEMAVLEDEVAWQFHISPWTGSASTLARSRKVLITPTSQMWASRDCLRLQDTLGNGKDQMHSLMSVQEGVPRPQH